LDAYYAIQEQITSENSVKKKENEKIGR